jgi:hypothetical protein
VVPTGGVVTLTMPWYLENLAASGAAMTIARAVSGTSGLSTFSTVYSGIPTPFYVDAGDGPYASGAAAGNQGAGPLQPSLGYAYRVTDVSGTTQVGPYYPTPAIVSKQDGMTDLFIRLLQAGISNATYPAGLGATRVTSEMPTRGFPALPFIVVNLDLLQMADTQIGQNAVNPNNNSQWSVPVFVEWTWRVSIFTGNARERDFLRDMLLGIWTSLLSSVFMRMGMDMEHSFQALSHQQAEDIRGTLPGFYAAEALFTIKGAFNTVIMTGLGYNEHILFTGGLNETILFEGQGAVQQAEVPLTE